MPQNKGIETKIQEAANDFSVHLNSICAGYPLVSVRATRKHPSILWQYENHDFLIMIKENSYKVLSASQLANNSFGEMNMPSFKNAIDLIRSTESLRQNCITPIVLLGEMPGTPL